MSGMVAWAHLDERLDSAREELTSTQKRCEPLTETQRRHANLVAERERIQKRLDLVDRLQDPQAAFRLIGLVSQSAQACSGGIRVRDFWLSEDRTAIVQPSKQASIVRQRSSGGVPKPVDPEPQPEVVPHSRLVLQGVAADNLAVAKFVVALRESGAFETVDLKSSMGASNRGRIRTYRIECVF